MKSRTFLLVIVITAIVVLAGLGVMYGNLFKIQKINIISDMLSEEECISVRELSGLKEGQNIFRVNTEKVIEKINASGTFEATTVTVLYPFTVNITVSERLPAALISYDEGYIVIDSNANVIRTAMGTTGYSLPIFTGIRISQYLKGDKLLTKDPYQRSVILTVIEGIAKSGSKDLVDIISLEDMSSVYLITKNGKRLDLCEAVDIDSKLELLGEETLIELILDGNDHQITIYKDYFTVS